MARSSSVSDMIVRLREGEKIKCLKCGNGHYITNNEHIKTSHSFWCDSCDDMLHTTSAVVVE